MKIAIVSLQYGKSVTGGGGVHVEEIADRLDGMGLDVTVLSIHTTKTVAHERRSGSIRVKRFMVEEGIEHPYVGSKDEELARIRKFCDAVGSWLKENGSVFDAVHMHGHHMVVGYLAGLIKGYVKRTVVTVHAVESLYEMEKLATGHSQSGAEHISRLRKLESDYRYADAIVAPSPAVKEQILGVMDEFGISRDDVTDRLHVITSGIDGSMLIPESAVRKKLESPPGANGGLKVIILSRIDPSKGLQFAIRGLRKVAEATGLRVKLFIVGRVSVDSYLRELRGEADGSGIEVVFHIDVSEERKLELLDEAQVYILPTLQDTFGITLVEAGARGNIIVTTDSDGPKYVMASPEKNVEHSWGHVTNYGVYAKKTPEVEENLPDNIAQALKWVLEHWKECTVAAVAFQKKIEREYMWDAVVRDYVNLYE